jgi:ankyrin repeat protein
MIRWHILATLAFLVLSCASSGEKVQSGSESKLPFSPLADASRSGDLKEVSRLLGAGAAIQQLSGDGNCSALVYAAAKGKFDVVRALVAAGADVNGRQDCEPPVISANEYVPIIKFLVSKGADVHATAPSNGWTLLHYGTQFLDLQLVDYALAVRIDANKPSKRNAVPLLLLFSDENLGINQAIPAIYLARQLVAQGADTSVRNDKGISPQSVLGVANKSEFLAALQKREDDYKTSPQYAAALRRIKLRQNYVAGKVKAP